jgi:hypothetical protein
MKTNYFSNCKTLEEVKKTYKKLALQHHPKDLVEVLSSCSASTRNMRTSPRIQGSSSKNKKKPSERIIVNFRRS